MAEQIKDGGPAYPTRKVVNLGGCASRDEVTGGTVAVKRRDLEALTRLVECMSLTIQTDSVVSGIAEPPEPLASLGDISLVWVNTGAFLNARMAVKILKKESDQ